jgi:hypothetical protein
LLYICQLQCVWPLAVSIVVEVFLRPVFPYTDNNVRELATVCLPWQDWTKALVWFDDVDISAFHSCVVIDLWQSVSEWHLLMSACVFVCRRENARSWIRAENGH